MEEDEEITGVMEEVCVEATLHELEEILNTDEKSTRIIPVESVEMYGAIAEVELDMLGKNNVMLTPSTKL